MLRGDNGVERFHTASVTNGLLRDVRIESTLAFLSRLLLVTTTASEKCQKEASIPELVKHLLENCNRLRSVLLREVHKYPEAVTLLKHDSHGLDQFIVGADDLVGADGPQESLHGYWRLLLG